MRPPHHVPAETIRLQGLASDPARSAWVSANAGSGKTHVLSQRVVRLLLDGNEPSKILCLTYTRAAAANMANRVFRDLSAWSLMADAELRKKITELTGRGPSDSRLALARRLFARALETPGGLKIQTIHAFCEAVLQQFPLEANIAGHFEMLDSEMETALVAEARRDMISGAAAGENRELAEAFADVLQRGGEFGLDELLGDVVAKRDALRGFIEEIGGPGEAYAELFEEFGFSSGDTGEAVAASFWPLPGFDSGFVAALQREAEATDAAAVKKNILPDLLAAFRDASAERRIELAAKALLKGDGEPYGSTTFKKALVARLPDLPERYAQAVQAVTEAKDRLALCNMLGATRSALTVADWLITRYERLKSGRGFLDFNDLINRTVRLLARDEASAWVQYKLDRGIDHILIDEAQDTSPLQWDVVKKLAAEFFAGQGARDNAGRTIFAVGDEKQSIYSFQGAEPAAFSESGIEFRKRVEAASQLFEPIKLRQSFRSTRDVLKAVDLVFAAEERRRGLTVFNDEIQHEGIRESEPGYVELWSSLGPVTVPEPDDWTVAIDHASAPAARLAETIAATVAGWMRDGEMLEGQGRLVRPGDIMVLVRKRDSFVHALSRALKNRGVPVAGADRLLLTDHIAVKDLLAIGRFALQPHDDLSLAALLRSPIFGLSDEQLFEVAHGRGKKVSLFVAMQAKAEGDAVLGEIVATLEDWRNQAGFRPAFEFYAGILAGYPGRDGARRKLVARLGPEAGDIIDEFMSFCLAVENTGEGGLEALIATLDTAAPEIKREMDQRRDEVRILTVHASKGLEAPVVFLVDSGGKPFVEQHLPRLLPFRSKTGAWQGDGFLWRCGADLKNSASSAISEEIGRKAEEEYRRLLYVGMTRAEDRLIVCGYHGVMGKPATTWHSMIEAGLGPFATEERDQPAECQPVRRYRVSEPQAIGTARAETAFQFALDLLPATLSQPLPAVPPLPRPLKPSGATATIEAAADTGIGRRSPVLEPEEDHSPARAWGTALHRLLQVLPDLPEAEREPAARRWLASFGARWDEAERERAWAAISAILSDSRFGPLFAPGSRAEVAIMGTLELSGRPRAISGKIDRLAVTPTEVLIVDFKTGRSVPADLADVPPEYVAQLALYRALLRPIYPGRAVSAALLYTAAPALLPLPEQALEDALARLTGS